MRKFIANILVILLPILFLYPQFSCGQNDSHKYDKSDTGKKIVYPDTVHLLNWNVAFTSSSAGSSAAIIKALEDSLIKYVQDRNSDTRKLLFILKYCPCDSLITNLDATAIYGSGNPVSPPPTQPKPGPTGDYAVGNNNFDVHIPDYKDSNNINYSLGIKYKDSISVLPASSKLHRLLAVIDTGLDTPLFRKAFPNWVWGGNLLWQDPANETLFNVVPEEAADKNVLKDSNPVKHGTSATEIILTQLLRLRNARIPQIMSIRAFDDKEKGTIYTVACALSYAIQHHADFINASWGYFGKEDPVLKKYLQKASDSSIRIIAAAGNSPGTHARGMICKGVINNLNSLERLKRSDSLFYPACFAPSIENLISVTQLQHAGARAAVTNNLIPCYYQNFSSEFVSTGAYEEFSATGNCCKFSIPFLMQPIEGSSFATPVMTAYFMSVLQDNNVHIKSLISSNTNRTANSSFTFNGNYYKFIQR
jgi:hypothetical protein